MSNFCGGLLHFTGKSPLGLCKSCQKVSSFVQLLVLAFTRYTTKHTLHIYYDDDMFTIWFSEFVLAMSSIQLFEICLLRSLLHSWSLQSKLERDPLNPFVVFKGHSSLKWDLNNQYCHVTHNSPYFRALFQSKICLTIKISISQEVEIETSKGLCHAKNRSRDVYCLVHFQAKRTTGKKSRRIVKRSNF